MCARCMNCARLCLVVSQGVDHGIFRSRGGKKYSLIKTELQKKQNHQKKQEEEVEAEEEEEEEGEGEGGWAQRTRRRRRRRKRKI